MTAGDLAYTDVMKETICISESSFAFHLDVSPNTITSPSLSYLDVCRFMCTYSKLYSLMQSSSGLR